MLLKLFIYLMKVLFLVTTDSRCFQIFHNGEILFTGYVESVSVSRAVGKQDSATVVIKAKVPENHQGTGNQTIM
jgi:hypothetical protein